MRSWWFDLALKWFCSVQGKRWVCVTQVPWPYHSGAKVEHCSMVCPTAPSWHCRVPPGVHGHPRGWLCVLSCMALSPTMWLLHPALLLYGFLWWCLCLGVTCSFPLKIPMLLSCDSRASKHLLWITDLSLLCLLSVLFPSQFVFPDWAQVVLAQTLCILGSNPFQSQPQSEAP